MFKHSHKDPFRKLGGLEWIAFFLTIIGAINWALVGAFSTDLVQLLFGGIGNLTRVIYVLIGISGIYIAWLTPRLVKR